MPRFVSAALRHFAFAVLDEAAKQAGHAPAQTAAARFAMIYLPNDGSDRTPFDTLWKALGLQDQIIRTQNVRVALNGLRRAHRVPVD